MATLVTALNTTFNAAAGVTFRVQASGGNAVLQSRATAGSAWVNEAKIGDVSPSKIGDSVRLVDNPIATTDWRLMAADGTTPTVIATAA